MTPKTWLLCGLLGLPAAACSSDEPCDPDAPGTICTIAGNGRKGSDGNQGPKDAREASLDVAMDVAVNPATGEPWIIDFNAYFIRAIDEGGQIRTVVGSGFLGDSPRPDVDGDAIPALEAELNHFPDLLFHDGYLYLAAWHNARIKRVELDTMMLSNFAGAARRVHYSGDGGPAMLASLDLPSSLAVHPSSGELYVMDQANQVIRKIDEDGVIERFAGNCVVDLDFVCAAGEEPATCPAGLDENKVVCGDPATECAKECNPGFGGDEGAHCLDIRMAQPYGQMADPAGRMAFDADGNLFFADTENHVIRRIDGDGLVTTYAGTAPDADGEHDGFSGEGVPATEAELDRPIDVEVAPDGTVYFTDTGNHCVRKVDPSGIIATVAGVCGPRTIGSATFGGDGGDPRAALLNSPYGIELDGDKLYVADSYNFRVRVVNL